MKKIKKNIVFIVLLVLVAIVVITSVILAKPPTAKEIFYDNVYSIAEVKAESDSVGESYGTAVCIKSDGTFVSNAHVVTYRQLGITRTFEKYYIRFAVEKEYREAELIKYDTEKDIAVLKVQNSSKVKAIKIGNSNELDYGDKVYAIGNGSNFGLSITQGIVSIPKIIVENDGVSREVIQSDITITSGNSGGALLNERGELVGLTTFRTKDNSGNVIYGIVYSIPINIVKAYAK